MKKASRELEKYNLYSTEVGLQVKWDKSGTEPTDDYTFLYANGNAHSHFRTGLFIYKENISAARRVDSVSDRMPYMALRGHWCHIIVLNVHAATED